MQFFTNRDAFDAELQLYSEPTLAKLMPARQEVLANEDGAICTPSGFAFPPCIILERGESLDEFARNVEYEFITVRAPAATHTAQRGCTVQPAAGRVLRLVSFAADSPASVAMRVRRLCRSCRRSASWRASWPHCTQRALCTGISSLGTCCACRRCTRGRSLTSVAVPAQVCTGSLAACHTVACLKQSLNIIALDQSRPSYSEWKRRGS